MAITKRQSTDLAGPSPIPSPPSGAGNQVFDYAPAPEATDHIKIRPRYGLFVGGRMVEPHSKKRFPTINPATEQKLAEVAEADAVDVDRAVEAAGKAFTSWSRLTPARRARYLFRISRLIQERARELAVVETMDGGKPIKESRDVDIPLSAAHFFYYAGWADKLEWAFPNRRVRPLGVAGQVIPWNFPLLMLSWKIAPALAAGNTVVLKPAETTPLSALLFAEICQQAELPPGVVNILTGAGKTGSLLVGHEDVKKVAFTGSTEVGKLIQRALAGTGKHLTLELGGKAANIVFEDAPLDQAVEGIINGIYFNQGHVCCAGSRLLVQESIAKPLLEKLKLRLSTLRLGDPLDKNTDIGAINSKAQLEKIQGLVASGIEEGAEMYQPECRLPERGFWFPPTLFTNVSQSYRIAREEIFGPVLSVLTFRTPAEAVEKANNTPYGLSAGVWTDKGSRILWISERMRAGVVWANTFNRFDPTSPFGGYKESGFGREGGIHGLLPYLELS
jgi:aldehyde dehydrogenase (NAD+)